MSMNPVKLPGHWGRPVDEGRLGRFMRPGLPTRPALPGAIEGWQVVPGLQPGLVVFSFTAFPDAGDAHHYGDDAGTLLAVRWSAGQFSGSFLPVLGQEVPVLMPEPAWGLTLAFTVAAVSQAGAGPSSGSISVTVPAPVVGPADAFTYSFTFSFG